MKGLKFALLLGTGVCFIAVPFLFLPWDIVEKVFLFFDQKPMGSGTASVYFFRISCAFSVFTGVYFLILSFNPLKYTPFLLLGVIWFFTIAVLSLIYGIQLNMYPYWFLFDTIACGGVAALIVLFWNKAKRKA